MKQALGGALSSLNTICTICRSESFNPMQVSSEVTLDASPSRNFIEINAWLDEHCSGGYMGEWRGAAAVFYFAKKEDASLFTIVWR